MRQSPDVEKSLSPFQFIVITLAGGMNQRQQNVIEYLREGKVEIAGIASRANGLLMSQVGRRATAAVEGILNGKRFLIHDHDPLFTIEFQSILTSVGVQCVKPTPRSPNLNAHAERFVRSIKESCLDRLILFGEGSLRRAICEFVTHYHHERNHQGLGNRLIASNLDPRATGSVCRRERLGGMLNYYYRAAA